MDCIGVVDCLSKWAMSSMIGICSAIARKSSKRDTAAIGIRGFDCMAVRFSAVVFG